MRWGVSDKDIPHLFFLDEIFMAEFTTEKIVMQGLAMANNLFCTGRPNKGMEMLLTVKKIAPEHPVLKLAMQKAYCSTMGQPAPDLDFEFGKMWLGEPLDNKSIEIFCDQGMGDTINLLRYVHRLKEKYNCKIILNCYSFYNQFERLIETQTYIDEFVPFHVVCDYSTNIMSLPSLLNGLQQEFYYPVHFEDNMQFEIPPQPPMSVFNGLPMAGNLKVGMAWQTNADNPLSQDKSIPVESFSCFNLPNVTSYCLQPKIDTPSWISSLPIEDLFDTAAFIQQCDCVISVDTAVLHLAGCLGKKTFGLVPHNCDPRWGHQSTTCWYPSVELFRQTEDKDWSKALEEIKSRLVSLSEIM